MNLLTKKLVVIVLFFIPQELCVQELNLPYKGTAFIYTLPLTLPLIDNPVDTGWSEVKQNPIRV
ncbi:hypothetical protein [Rickettsia endosymbiont of Halotydeus destructor]|uniref:hypothetical protein n=1 Tax=Rickettsia endosymbiont of Halotydeus destructor TaxID=2996754 RepID=UPI003BAFB7E4